MKEKPDFELKSHNKSLQEFVRWLDNCSHEGKDKMEEFFREYPSQYIADYRETCRRILEAMDSVYAEKTGTEKKGV